MFSNSTVRGWVAYMREDLDVKPSTCGLIPHIPLTPCPSSRDLSRSCSGCGWLRCSFLCHDFVDDFVIHFFFFGCLFGSVPPADSRVDGAEGRGRRGLGARPGVPCCLSPSSCDAGLARVRRTPARCVARRRPRGRSTPVLRFAHGHRPLASVASRARRRSRGALAPVW